MVDLYYATEEAFSVGIKQAMYPSRFSSSNMSLKRTSQIRAAGDGPRSFELRSSDEDDTCEDIPSLKFRTVQTR
ncbi:hypothetical protein TNCV_2244971 [Trichonephila clavipes]|nr:hypothetical protein TNCV_2244971 [Trichonephila clavipes]